MHAPDGKSFRNESVFAEIKPPTRIVVQHESAPKYCLTIDLAASVNGSIVSWLQEFESAEVAQAIQHIFVPANEQNLDRLTAEVLRKPPMADPKVEESRTGGQNAEVQAITNPSK